MEIDLLEPYTSASTRPGGTGTGSLQELAAKLAARASIISRKMGRGVLAAVMILFGVSASVAFLMYAPAHVTLRVIDPPPERYDGSIQAIYITFTRIEIHAANAGDSSGWYNLTSSSTINLLEVLNVSRVLGEATVPRGKYTEIRFFAREANVTINGSDVTFTIPSGNQSGIKAVISGGGLRIYGGQSLGIELDVAFRNSEIMNNPSRILRPVVTATTV